MGWMMQAPEPPSAGTYVSRITEPFHHILNGWATSYYDAVAQGICLMTIICVPMEPKFTADRFKSVSLCHIVYTT